MYDQLLDLVKHSGKVNACRPHPQLDWTQKEAHIGYHQSRNRKRNLITGIPGACAGSHGRRRLRARRHHARHAAALWALREGCPAL